MYLHVLSKGLRVDIMTKQERKFVYTQEYDLYILGKSQCEKEKGRDSLYACVCVCVCVCVRAHARVHVRMYLCMYGDNAAIEQNVYRRKNYLG